MAPIPPLCNSFGPTRWRLVMPTNPHRLEEDVLRIVERLGGQAEATENLQEYEGGESRSSAVMFAIQRAPDACTRRLPSQVKIAATPTMVVATSPHGPSQQ